MNLNIKYTLSILLTFVLVTDVTRLSAQTTFVQDYSQLMEIPDVTTLESSATHLYVLSESEGLIVFRAHTDSLQWLYSSTGMQQRGNQLQADVRFAYLYGNGRRLTVIEPTSVLGVYSATVLPEEPFKVKRIANSLYIVLKNNELARIGLESPEAVDTEVEIINHEVFSGKKIIDITTDLKTLLYVLTDQNTIELFRHDNNRNIPEHQQTIQVDRMVSSLFFTGNDIYAIDTEGSIFTIAADGKSKVITSINAPVKNLDSWNDYIIVRTENGLLWSVNENGESTIWKNNPQSGNHFTVANNTLWISENNQVFPVQLVPESENARETANESNKVTLKPISDITIPFPKSILIPLEIEENHSPDDIEFSYQSSIKDASIKGYSFYWQPTATQTGRHRVNIIAQMSKGFKDSTSFWIDLRSFNAPPRFTPHRAITIPANESFELEIKAVDPDGVNPELIRYLGVDLPDGALLNEQTGLFRWTPTLRQVRTWEFRVIATDQFGAASSQNIEIKVIEMESGESGNLN